MCLAAPPPVKPKCQRRNAPHPASPGSSINKTGSQRGRRVTHRRPSPRRQRRCGKCCKQAHRRIEVGAVHRLVRVVAAVGVATKIMATGMPAAATSAASWPAPLDSAQRARPCASASAARRATRAGSQAAGAQSKRGPRSMDTACRAPAAAAASARVPAARASTASDPARISTASRTAPPPGCRRAAPGRSQECRT